VTKEPLRDIVGRRLGVPHEVRSIVTKEDLRSALEAARSAGRPLVPLGLRSSYWQNVSVEDAVVADLSGFSRIVAIDVDDGIATVESGTTIRALDAALRARGFHVPMHPDAFGDTLVGSAIANGVTAGIGMMRGDFLDAVIGFGLLLPDGREVHVGASRLVRGAAGAIARGLPDVRSLVFGAQGALGVVTEVDLALVPTPWEARLTYGTDDDRFDEVLAFARHWRRRGAIDTIRWTWEGRGELFVTASSAVSEAELEARVAAIRSSLEGWPPPVTRVASDAERGGALPDYDAHWPGPPGSTWRNARKQPFFGLDGVVPYGCAAQTMRWARDLSLSVPHRRRVAAYFGPDGVNVGIHAVAEDAERRDEAANELDARATEYGAMGAVAYRPGAVWIDDLAWRADADTIELLRALAAAFDPDGTMNPGGRGLFSIVPRKGARS
jgi:FAD/FMN-containing dehydrogenase